MSQELIYTSTTKGLKLGSRGFCTVASTSGMAKNLADRLEALSGYKHLFSTGDPQAKLNPVNTSYLRFKLGGRVYYVLSRIADAGLDYTQRTNKLAHHVVLSREELAIAGPAWVASQGGFFQTIWEGEARILPSDRPIPQGDLQIGVCHAWARIVGDAGWAGVLAESILKRSSTEAYLVCKPGTDVLALFLEAQALLPSDKRWEATFSTYFTKVPPGVECRWRCAIDGTPEAVRARRSPEKLVIDLTGPLAAAEGGRLVVAARSGVLPEPDEIETIQPVGGEVQQKTPTLPPSVPPAEINLKVGPPVLPRQKQAVFRSAGHKVEKQSIWKVVAIISLLVIALIGGAFIRSIYSTSQMPKVPSVKNSSSAVDDLQETDGKDVSSAHVDVSAGKETALPSPTEHLHDPTPPADSLELRNPTPSVQEGPPGNTTPSEPDIPKLLFNHFPDFTPLKETRRPVTVLKKTDPLEKVTLGSLQGSNLPIEVKLLGIPSRNKSPLLRIQDITVSRKWEIISCLDKGDKEEAVGVIWIGQDTSGENGQGEAVFFRWKMYVTKHPKIAEMVRKGILAIYAPNSKSPKHRKYVSFLEPIIKTDSIRFGKRLQNKGIERCILNHVRVPIDQYAVIDGVVNGLPGPGGIAFSIELSAPHSISFGKGSQIKIILGCELDDERKLAITAQTFIPDYEEYSKGSPMGLDSLKKLLAHRNALRSTLEKSIIEHVMNAGPREWKTLGVIITQEPVQENFGPPIKGNFHPPYVKLGDVESWFSESMRQETSLSGVVNRLGGGTPVDLLDKLDKHKKDYKHLEEYMQILKVLPNSLELRVVIMRRPTDCDENERDTAEVLLYTNDKS